MVKRCSNLATYQGVKYGSPDRTSQFNGQLWCSPAIWRVWQSRDAPWLGLEFCGRALNCTETLSPQTNWIYKRFTWSNSDGGNMMPWMMFEPLM
jgi:hypothetical protein